MTDNRERILIYTVIGVVVIAVLVMLVFIWKPATRNPIAENLNVIQFTEDYENVQKGSYEDLLKQLLLITNYDKLFEKVDTDWLNQVSMDKESLQDWLIKENLISRSEPQIKDSTIITSNEYYIYRFEIITGDEVKFVLINEKLPGDFTISFEQKTISKLVDREFITNAEDGVEYIAKTTSVLSNVLQFDIRITNSGEDEHYYSIGKNYCIKLVLSDGTKIDASDISSVAGTEVNLWPGNTFDVRVTFFISPDKQNLVDSIEFANAYDPYKKINPVINLKEGGN